MSIYNWALLFKQLMNIVVSFFNIVVLPGTDITFMDIAIWGVIIFLLVKALLEVYH